MRIAIYAVLASILFGAQTIAQTLVSGVPIAPGSLTPVLAQLAQNMGGRMTSAANAQVTLTGTVTDANGSRAATLVIQAPGLLSYRESGGRAITFNGTSFQTKSGAPTSIDTPIEESLLANLPDAILLQARSGGGIRTIGRHFRNDDGRTQNYSGPYWTIIAFAPTARPGLTWGQPLQQEVFLAIDEQTWRLAEVRRAVQIAPNTEQVTQTQFQNWTQYGNQWFPGKIVRLEAGRQTLQFAVNSAVAGTAAAVTAFQP
jgi:hypothetical protein